MQKHVSQNKKHIRKCLYSQTPNDHLAKLEMTFPKLHDVEGINGTSFVIILTDLHGSTEAEGTLPPSWQLSLWKCLASCGGILVMTINWSQRFYEHAGFHRSTFLNCLVLQHSFWSSFLKD